MERHFLTPAPLPCINQVDEVKLLGVYLTNTFSSTAHVNHLLTIGNGNQRLFLLSQLKNQELALDSLHVVYQAIIQSKIIYAFPAFAGQLTAMDIRLHVLMPLLAKPTAVDLLSNMFSRISVLGGVLDKLGVQAFSQYDWS